MLKADPDRQRSGEMHTWSRVRCEQAQHATRQVPALPPPGWPH